MENKIFPLKMIEHNVEGLFARHHTGSQILYLTVILGLIATFIALPYIHVDITKQSRGIIRAEQDNNQVAGAIYGQVTEVFIEENQKVNAGDKLLMLSTAKIEEQIDFQREKIAQNQKYIQDLKTLLNDAGKVPQTSLYGQEYLQFQQRLAEQNLKLDYQQREFNRAKELFDGGVIAKAEYEQRLFDLDLTKNAQRLHKEQQYKTWELELNNYSNQTREMKAQITQLERDKEQYVITAPISGTITQFAGIQPGNFIAPNQTIAQISSNKDLMVESYISPADIGLIREGMAVRFQIDAFNYNQWGLATGKVVSISKDISAQQEQPVFKVKCSLGEEYLALKNGYEGNLKKGMTLTSRFTITERSLYQLLYDKMDDWLNPKLG